MGRKCDVVEHRRAESDNSGRSRTTTSRAWTFRRRRLFLSMSVGLQHGPSQVPLLRRWQARIKIVPWCTGAFVGGQLLPHANRPLFRYEEEVRHEGTSQLYDAAGETGLGKSHPMNIDEVSAKKCRVANLLVCLYLGSSAIIQHLRNSRTGRQVYFGSVPSSVCLTHRHVPLFSQYMA